MRSVGSEEELTFMLAQYLRINYPNVLYHFDYGAGVKLTMGQAAKQKRLNKRAWPDLFIAEPAAVPGTHAIRNGLFLEIKREGTRLTKRNGEWASDHLAEQEATLERLRDVGYVAQFAVGFDECQQLIDSYLSRSWARV